MDLADALGSIAGYLVGICYGFFTNVSRAITSGDKDEIIRIFSTVVLAWVTISIAMRLLKSLWGTVKMFIKFFLLLTLVFLAFYAYTNGVDTLVSQLQTHGFYFVKAYGWKVGQAIFKANDFLETNAKSYVNHFVPTSAR